MCNNSLSNLFICMIKDWRNRLLQQKILSWIHALFVNTLFACPACICNSTHWAAALCHSIFQPLNILTPQEPYSFISSSLYAGYLKLAPLVLMFQELPLLVYIVLTFQLQTTYTLVMPLLLVMMLSLNHYGTFKGEMGSPSSTAQWGLSNMPMGPPAKVTLSWGAE